MFLRQGFMPSRQMKGGAALGASSSSTDNTAPPLRATLPRLLQDFSIVLSLVLLGEEKSVFKFRFFPIIFISRNVSLIGDFLSLAVRKELCFGVRFESPPLDAAVSASRKPRRGMG